MVVVVVLAILTVSLVMRSQTSREQSKLIGHIRARSQQPRWGETASELSTKDLATLRRRRKKAISKRRSSGYRKPVHRGDSSLLSDRLIGNDKVLTGQLKSGRFGDLKAQVEELATRGWTQSEVDWKEGFLLDPARLDTMAEPAEIVEALLNHARRTTPEFSVPWLTPRTVVEQLPPATAGQFVVDGGWVTIKLGPKFFGNRGAAQAILAHEACHYILNNSGFRKRDIALNERYTDICMFVCGFGKLFLDGYQKYPSNRQYRRGHRVGYLTDMEYAFIYQYVLKLRKHYRENLKSELTGLKETLLRLVRGDQEMLESLIEAERSRTPDKSEAGLYENAIFRRRRP